MAPEGAGLSSETSARSESKKPPDPGKSENEGIQRFPGRTRGRAGLILLFDGEVATTVLIAMVTRRAQTSRYPDFGRFVSPAFPAFQPVALPAINAGESSLPVTVAQPSPIHTGFPDAGLWCFISGLNSACFKERCLNTPLPGLCKDEVASGGSTGVSPFRTALPARRTTPHPITFCDVHCRGLPLCPGKRPTVIPEVPAHRIERVTAIRIARIPQRSSVQHVGWDS